METPHKERFSHTVSLALILVVLIVFLNTLNNGFTYDDLFLIVGNQHNISKIENIPLLFTERYFYISKEGSYRPIVTLSYFWDQLIGGTPFFYHLSNLALHIINTLLLYYLFIILSHNQAAAAISVLIYSIHPVLTEAINGVGFREDILAGVFISATLIFHIKGLIPLSMATYTLSLLSKEMGLVVPLLLFIYNRLYHRHIRLRVYLSYIVITCLYLLVRFYLLYNPAERDFVFTFSTVDKFIAIPMAVLHYTRILFFPVSLSADYIPYNFLTSPEVYVLALSNILFLLMMVYLIRIKSANISAKFGLYWFLVTLIPMLNLTAIANPFAERYLYAPAAGFILFIVSSFFERYKPTFRITITMALVPILFFFAILTPLRSAKWKAEGDLWKDTIKKTPMSYRAYQNVAVQYIKDNDYDNAKALLDKAVLLKPDSAIVHNNIGAAYMNIKPYDRAIEEFNLVIKLDPSFARAYLHLGIVYEIKGDNELSRKNYEKAIELDKGNPEAYLHLGMVLGRMGKLDKAIDNFKKALEIHPSMSDVHYNMGVAYEQKGMHIEASEEYISELNLNPSYQDARLGLARIYIKNGLLEDAKSELVTLIQEVPNNKEAKDYLGYIRKMKKQ